MSLAAYVQKIMHFCARHRKLLLSICGTLCAVALFFYLRAFFATGVDMDGVFLTKQKNGGTVIYTGSNSYGTLCVSVSQSDHGADVVYTVPHNKAHTYTCLLYTSLDYLIRQFRYVRMLSYKQNPFVVFSAKSCVCLFILGRFLLLRIQILQ